MDYDVRIESFSTIADKDNHADAGAPLSRSRREIVFDGVGGPPSGVPDTVNRRLFPSHASSLSSTIHRSFG
jgi:hypothetical protein